MCLLWQPTVPALLTSAKKSMFCEQCGTVWNDGAKFCENCGSPKVDSSKPVATVASSQPSLTRR